MPLADPRIYNMIYSISQKIWTQFFALCFVVVIFLAHSGFNISTSSSGLMKTEGCYDANFVVNGGTTSDKVGIMITLGAQWLLHGHWGNRDTPSVCEETLNSLRWRHNELDGVSVHQPRDCLPNRLFGRRTKRTSKLRVTGLCAGNSPGTGEFSAQMASNAENVSIWWRHHVYG